MGDGMSLSADQDPTEALARIMAARRSVRSFSAVTPTRRDVQRIIAAGLAAPYAAAMSAEGALDRRFFVLSRAGAALGAAAVAIQNHAQQALAAPETPAALRARLEPVAEGRILGVGTAPYYIVVAERQTLAAPQSLAHALENMWLMATALGLGMHLVSVTTTMGDDPQFCETLGLPVGEYALNGCALGVPAQACEARAIPDAASVTTWLD
jgi:nitroreductase